MRKKISILVYVLTIMFFVFGILHKAGSLDSLYTSMPLNSKDEFSEEVVTTFGEESKVPFIVYYPNVDGELDFRTLDINLNSNIYKNILEALIEYKPEYFQGEYTIKSIQRENSLLRLKLSSSFKSDLSTDEERFNLILMSFVNTLSEVKGIEFVEVYSGKERISIDGVSKFKKDLEIINIDEFNAPDKVLKEQMNLEQKGEYLKAYLLMSSRQTANRKMYHEYFKEMKDIEEVGFLDGSFNIKNTVINNNEATVNVEFKNVSVTGEYLNSSTMPVKCIKLNGIWLVDW